MGFSVLFHIWLWLSKPIGSHFGVGAPPILVHFSGDWDVNSGYDLVAILFPTGGLPWTQTVTSNGLLA